jgi:hypothetical protein
MRTYVEIPQIGRVSGEITLYQDSLNTGKSEEVGRSNGFFIMVRGRLINEDDSHFGTGESSYQTFNRLHAVLYADGLDDSLVASREAVLAEARNAFQQYLLAKYNEVRNWYENYLSELDVEEAVGTRLEAVPGFLARLPLRYAIERARTEEWTILHGIRLPAKGTEMKTAITGFESAPLDVVDPLAVFDASSGTLRVNTNHPFYLNFHDDTEEIEEIAVAEVLLEAYLYEAGYSPEEVMSLMRRRDDLLRALVRQYPRSVTAIADRLRNSVHDYLELEHACHGAFEVLGFQVAPMGGPGKPDGLAEAPLAPGISRKQAKGQERSYKLTYDAKSTKHDKVKSKDLGLATVARHRTDFAADYAVVIAPDFESEEDGEESKEVKEAMQQGVCLIRARDFATLLEVSGSKPLPLDQLEELFSCRSPDESREWIMEFKNSEPTTQPDYLGVLETIHKLQCRYPNEPPSFGAIKFSNPKFAEDPELTETMLSDWVETIERIVPELVHVYRGKAEITQTPGHIIDMMHKRLGQHSK